MSYRRDLIRAALVNRDLTRAAFAEQSGIGLNTVGKLWNGDVNIRLSNLIQACSFLEIPLPQIFTSDDNNKSGETNESIS